MSEPVDIDHPAALPGKSGVQGELSAGGLKPGEAVVDVIHDVREVMYSVGVCFSGGSDSP